VKKMEEFTLLSVSKVLGMSEPEFKSKIDVMTVIKPSDFEQMTLNYHGSFGGFQYTNYNAVRNMIPHETLVNNLFLAGQWVGAGAGYENTLAGGINVADIIIKRMK